MYRSIAEWVRIHHQMFDGSVLWHEKFFFRGVEYQTILIYFTNASLEVFSWSNASKIYTREMIWFERLGLLCSYFVAYCLNKKVLRISSHFPRIYSRLLQSFIQIFSNEIKILYAKYTRVGGYDFWKYFCRSVGISSLCGVK